MIRRANNLFNVLLNDAATVSSALPAVGTVVSDSNLADGAIVLCDVGLRRMSNTEYAALANGDQFIIVQGKGAGVPLMKSPVLTKGQVKFTISKHKAAQQQITTIGFNGTTGSLPVANDTTFFIKIKKQDNDAANRSQPAPLFAGPVKTDGTGTQEELAVALVKSGIKNFADEPGNGYLYFEAINDEAGSAIAITAGADATHYTVVNGSATVTGTDSAGVAMLGTDEVNDVALTVGDYFRAGTDTTVGLYKITAITSGTATTPMTLTLDTPYQGPNATIAIGSTEYVAAADATAAEWGIRIIGKANRFDVNKMRDYYANRFTATFSDPDTLVTHTQGAFNGNGVWQQVAFDEYMSYGYEGQNEMLGTPPTMRDQEVKIPGTGSNTALTSKYSALNIAWTETIQDLVSLSGAKGNVIVYLNLTDSSGSGVLPTGTDNTGETFVVALGLTAADFNE
jgi:hypothetical protein